MNPLPLEPPTPPDEDEPRRNVTATAGRPPASSCRRRRRRRSSNSYAAMTPDPRLSTPVPNTFRTPTPKVPRLTSAIGRDGTDRRDEVLVPATPTPNASSYAGSHSPGLMSGQEPLVIMSLSNSRSNSNTNSNCNSHTPAHAERSLSRRVSSRRLSFGVWSPAQGSAGDQNADSLPVASPNIQTPTGYVSLQIPNNQRIAKTQRAKRRSVSISAKDNADNHHDIGDEEIAQVVQTSPKRGTNKRQKLGIFKNQRDDSDDDVNHEEDDEIEDDDDYNDEEILSITPSQAHARSIAAPVPAPAPAPAHRRVNLPERASRGYDPVLTPPRKRMSRKLVLKPTAVEQKARSQLTRPQPQPPPQPQPQSSIYSHAINDGLADSSGQIGLREELNMVYPPSADSLRDLSVRRKTPVTREVSAKSSRMSNDREIKIIPSSVHLRTRFAQANEAKSSPAHDRTTPVSSLSSTVMKVRSMQSKKPISTPPATSTLAFRVKHASQNYEKVNEDEEVETPKPKPLAKQMQVPVRRMNLKPNITIHKKHTPIRHRISLAPPELEVDEDTKDDISSGYDSSSTDSRSPRSTAKRRLRGQYGNDEIDSKNSPVEQEAVFCRPVSVSIPGGAFLSPSSSEQSDDEDINDQYTDQGTMDTSFAQRLKTR